MVEHHVSLIEGIVHGVEDRIAEWRRQDAARKAEADADRDELWAEAAERERLLDATMEREQVRRGAPQSATGGHQVVFVVASDAFADKLQHFSPERDQLVRVIPARESGGGTGLRGSWLVFEKG
jgi:hypothetical protein